MDMSGSRAAAGEGSATPKMRIAFIMHRYAHNDVRVAHKEAWGLHATGYEITLLCKEAPTPEYLGMKIIAANAPAMGAFRALLNAPDLLRQAIHINADVYVAKNPDGLVVAWLLALLGKKVVYSNNEDFLRKAELHPRVPRRLSRLIGSIIVAAEYLTTRIVNATVVTQPSVQRRYRPHAELVQNAPLTEGPVLQEADRIFATLPKNGAHTLVYAGIIRRCRGLGRMLDLVEALNRSQPWRLKMMGPFTYPQDLTRAQSHPGWQYVEYLGCVSHAESLANIRNADFGLALLSDVGGFSKASITKLYEYMLLETPFVTSDFPMWRDSIQGTHAGLWVNPEDDAELAEKIQKLFADTQQYEQMQYAGRQFIEQQFNWRIASKPWQEIAERLSRELFQSTANGL